MEKFSIIPVKVGQRSGGSKAAMTYLVDWFTKLDPIYYIMFLIKGHDKVILVDTGGGDEPFVHKHHYDNYRRSADEAPLPALKKLGVTPDDIDIVINTHLHWDHCFNNDLFPKAKIYVQKRELQCAVSPLPTQGVPYESHLAGMTPRWFIGYDRIVAVDGDKTLLPGVDLVTLPGHTPGFQGVNVNTEDGQYLIAGDTLALFENWEGKGHFAHIASAVHYNLEEYYQTFDKIERMRCSFILPGHDPKVFEHAVYPFKG